MIRRYKIADKVAEINSIYEQVHNYCADYQTDEKADYYVSITQADIDFERKKSDRERALEGNTDVDYIRVPPLL